MNLKIDGIKEQFIRCSDFIENHDDFLVVSHVQADGDAVSSTCAVGWLLQYFDKKFIMINEDELPTKFKYLWGYSHIINYRKSPISNKKYKYVIAVDCADYSRIGKVSELFHEEAQILNIDHHPTNDRYGVINFVKDDAAATVQLLFNLIQHMNITLDLDIANCLYTGLLTDTGGFRYANTTPKVMEMAANLLNQGVNANKMAEELLERLTISHIQLLQKALNSLSFSKDNKICWVSISLEDMNFFEASSDDLEGIVNYPRNIEGVEVGVFLKELKDRQVKVSFRSLGNVNVAQLAQTFGGGGHVLASGATIDGSMEEVTSLVVQAIERILQ